MPDQPPDNPSSTNWLKRQWERIRHGRWRDVIIVSVEEGASNVAAGKYILQINVAGRNLAIPVIWIALSMVIVVTLLLYPIVKPLFRPAKMQGGTLRVAVADFGEVLPNGQVRHSQRGALLSTWLYDELRRTIAAEPDNLFVQGINIWHNTRLDTARDIQLAPLQDEQAAARLSRRIGAQLIIYGDVTSSPAGEALDLKFYVAAALPDDGNLLLGPHVLGRPLELPTGTGSDLAANLVVIERIQTRTQALASLVTGLTQQILGRTRDALATFRQAENTLSEWPDDAGKDTLYFLIGREELFLGNVDQAEHAFLAAIAINPEYARGHAALGSAYFTRAQQATPELRMQVGSDLGKATTHQQLAIVLASRQGNRLVEALSRVALAKSYRLQGESAYLLDDFDQARRLFALVDTETSQAIPVLTGLRQYRLLAQAYEVQGAASLQDADILIRTGDPQQAEARLERARTAYLQCIAQGESDQLDQLLDDVIIAQHCRPNLETVDRIRQQLEKQG